MYKPLPNMRKFLCLILIYLACCMSVSTAAFGADNLDDELPLLEQRVLDRINQARRNPLETAANLGLNPDQVLSDFPYMADTLHDGMAPLLRNAVLEQAADGHTEEMFENAYYSRTSIDGASAEERMIQAGYDPKVSAEKLGVLVFLNYIPSEKLVDIILDRILAQELDKEHPEHLTILDPELKEIGLGLRTGTMFIEGRLYQACILTIDMGTPLLSQSGADALRALINQARADLAGAVMDIGYDPAELRARYPHLSALFESPLPALRSNPQLAVAAQGHAADMAEGQFFSHIASDGATLAERLAAADYQGLDGAERLSRFNLFEGMDAKAAAAEFFRRMLIIELNAGHPDDMVILNPELSEVGIAVEMGLVTNVDGRLSNVFLAVCNAGRPVMDVDFGGLMGVVYQDRDGNGRYSPDEGFAGTPIRVEGFEAIFGTDLAPLHLTTDAAGGFEIALPPSTVVLSLATPDGPLQTQAVSVGWGQKWVNLAAVASGPTAAQ